MLDGSDMAWSLDLAFQEVSVEGNDAVAMFPAPWKSTLKPPPTNTKCIVWYTCFSFGVRGDTALPLANEYGTSQLFSRHPSDFQTYDVGNQLVRVCYMVVFRGNNPTTQIVIGMRRGQESSWIIALGVSSTPDSDHVAIGHQYFFLYPVLLCRTSHMIEYRYRHTSRSVVKCIPWSSH